MLCAYSEGNGSSKITDMCFDVILVICIPVI